MINQSDDIREGFIQTYMQIALGCGIPSERVSVVAEDLTDITIQKAILEAIKKKENWESMTEADIQAYIPTIPTKEFAGYMFDAGALVVKEFLKQVMPTMDEQAKQKFLALLEQTTKEGGM